ncbi:MAG: cytochrome c1 [Burkholderiales bacterium]|jgi:ubiquinol-cytochrome c reductase cytochrome c1 subunit
MKTLALLLAIAAAAAAAPAARAEGPDLMMVPALGHRLDDESLQRGARDFANYCQGCHSAKYMRYNRLADIGLTEDDIRNNLIFGEAKIGDTMNVAMRPADAKAWFGNPPPDLSVEARVRGTTWLFNYLIGFYRDPKSSTGWNNLVFPNVGMPHVLAELQGPRKLVETEYEDHEKALGAAIAAKTLVGIEPATNGKWTVSTLENEAPGTMTQVAYEGTVADLVNYLDYIAEPAKNQRIRLGMIVLLFLGVLFVLVYALKREFWRDVH